MIDMTHSNSEEMNSLNSALSWHNAGIAVIPILAGSKSPALDSWREYQQRLPTERELQCWFSRPGYNIAVITGWRGLAVIDWDDIMAYSAWLAGLSADMAALVLRTYQVRTSRGFHLYMYSNKAARSAHNPGRWDVKAAGGYVLAPPSVHPSGATYVGYGSIESIMRVEGIESILPGYGAALEIQHARPVGQDAFDQAMQLHIEAGAIEAIKAQVSIADMLGQNGNEHRVWMTVCPLHGDTKPSFAVYPDGRFYCFGCGAHGDVIDLYAAMHHVSNAAAIQELRRA